MKALITGASSGIGRDMARILSRKGFDLILAARNEKKLVQLKSELGGNVRIIRADLAKKENCIKLYELTKNENVNVLINNAGFGHTEKFVSSSLELDLELVDVNIRALHILTKLFLRDFVKADSGYILNVASIAAFIPGPYMSVYYASKAYVLRLTQAVSEELRRDKSRVYIGALCPGPVKTEFWQRANGKIKMNALSSEYVARYAIENMLKRKKIIVPGLSVKALRHISGFIPSSIIERATASMQRPR